MSRSSQASDTAGDEQGYAEAMTELEEILERLDDDAVDVDLLSTQVERAAELIRFCRGRIRAAQLSVEEIVAELDDLVDVAAYDQD
jgi:exodeoxyribonuclease VII small subunit